MDGVAGTFFAADGAAGLISDFFFGASYATCASRSSGYPRVAPVRHSALSMHPRVASEYEGPTAKKRLEPPGFLALHYGRNTPLVTLVAHIVYGAVLGAGFAV